MLSNANTSTHAPSSIGSSLWIFRVYSHSFSSPLNLPFSSQLDIPENNQPNVVFFSRIFFPSPGLFRRWTWLHCKKNRLLLNLKNMSCQMFPTSAQLSQYTAETYKIDRYSHQKRRMLSQRDRQRVYFGICTWIYIHCNTLQHKLQHIATHSALQHIATHCNTLQHARLLWRVDLNLKEARNLRKRPHLHICIYALHPRKPR